MIKGYNPLKVCFGIREVMPRPFWDYSIATISSRIYVDFRWKVRHQIKPGSSVKGYPRYVWGLVREVLSTRLIFDGYYH
jgi:hypothetical protein